MWLHGGFSVTFKRVCGLKYPYTICVIRLSLIEEDEDDEVEEEEPEIEDFESDDSDHDTGFTLVKHKPTQI